MGAAAAVIMMRERRLVEAFTLAAATSPDRALPVETLGVDYDALTADDMVVCDLHGNLVDGRLSPSSDTAAHAYVYRHMPEVGGVVHTHSTYATAWAARGEPIPCVLTIRRLGQCVDLRRRA